MSKRVWFNGEKWLGGYVRVDSRGRPTFMIQRRMRGHKYHLSTQCHSEGSALTALKRFEDDPAGFGAPAPTSAEPVRITGPLLAEYEAYCLTPKPDGAGNGRKHAREKIALLKTWLVDLNGADLKHLSLVDKVKPALRRHQKGRQHRIIALKDFYAWLREERHLLTHADDPTLDLPVPKGSPEKNRRKKAQPVDAVRATLDKLAEFDATGHRFEHRYLDRKRGKTVVRVYSTGWGLVRDWLLFHAATGWHSSEVRRFAAEPVLTELKNDPRGVAVVEVLHKSGRWHRTTLRHPEQLAAAKRIAGTREPPRFTGRVKAASRAAGVPDVRPGVIRHSVGTWFVEAANADVTDEGAMRAAIKAGSEFLGHQSERTFKDFYLDVMVPQASKAPLVH